MTITGTKIIVYLISIVRVSSEIIDISVSMAKGIFNYQQTSLNIALQFKERVDNEDRKQVTVR